MATTEYYVAQGHSLGAAKEKSANDRAKLEGYESAAHKEAHANVKPGIADIVGGAAQAERLANDRAAQVTDPRTGAPFQSASDMEAYANEQSQKVFNPRTGAMFTSAVDYEIDANRRARLNDYLNAADYESGLRTRSYEDFIDPRDVKPDPIPPQFAAGTANQYVWDETTGEPTYVGDTTSAAAGLPLRPSGAAGAMDLLSYRPGTQKYWDQYLPDAAKGLLYMNAPQKEYSLAYAPGEFLNSNTWRGIIDAPGDQMRDIPAGAWRYATYQPRAFDDKGQPLQGVSAIKGALNTPGWPEKSPWQFTSPAMATNIAQQPWSAAQMNLTPEQGKAWQGLLAGLGTAPAIDTTPLSLLGVA